MCACKYVTSPLQSLYEEMEKYCGDFMSPRCVDCRHLCAICCIAFLSSYLLICSDQCMALMNEMSDEIGRVNLYDIYTPCDNDMGDTIEYARYI